jgi:hypothetical protein
MNDEQPDWAGHFWIGRVMRNLKHGNGVLAGNSTQALIFIFLDSQR